MAINPPASAAQISDLVEASLDLIAAGDPHHLIAMVQEVSRAAHLLDGQWGDGAAAIRLATSVYRHCYSLATEEDRAASIAPYGV